MANDLQADAGRVEVTDDEKGEALVAKFADAQVSCSLQAARAA